MKNSPIKSLKKKIDTRIENRGDDTTPFREAFKDNRKKMNEADLLKWLEEQDKLTLKRGNKK